MSLDNTQLMSLISLLLLMRSKKKTNEEKLKYKGTYYEDFLAKAIKTGNNVVLMKKLRVKKESFDYINQLMTNSIAFTYFRNSNLKSDRFVPIEKQVCVYLYFISRNYQYDDIAELFGLSGASMVCQIIDRASRALVEYKDNFI